MKNLDERLDEIKNKEDEKRIIKEEILSFMEEADFMYELVRLVGYER